jgi:hypothetical protein
MLEAKAEPFGCDNFCGVCCRVPLLLEIKAGCNEISKEKRTDYGELTRRISK